MRAPGSLSLSDDDLAALDGERGAAARLAMRILARTAEAMDAAPARRVLGAHRRLLVPRPCRARLRQAPRRRRRPRRDPHDLNVSSLDLLHPELVHLDRETAADARALMDAYLAMGCRPTWTCAPTSWRCGRPRRARRLGRVERDRLRQLRARSSHRPLRRLHRHLLRDHRASTRRLHLDGERLRGRCSASDAPRTVARRRGGVRGDRPPGGSSHGEPRCRLIGIPTVDHGRPLEGLRRSGGAVGRRRDVPRDRCDTRGADADVATGGVEPVLDPRDRTSPSGRRATSCRSRPAPPSGARPERQHRSVAELRRLAGLVEGRRLAVPAT